MTRTIKAWRLATVRLRWVTLVALVVVALAAAPGSARGEPTTAPAAPLYLALNADGEPTAPGESAGASEAAEPTAPAEAAGEPQAPAAPGEPQAPPQAPKARAQATAAAQYGLGVELRATFVPTWMLGAFLDASTALYSSGFGIEGVRRKDGLDLIASLDFAFYSPPDGNYLGSGDDPARKTDYIHFDGLSTLTLAMHFIRHEEILPWMSFIWGAGVGLSLVLGDVFRASNAGCTADNVGDLGQCHPIGMDPTQPERWVNDPANGGVKADDSVESPKLWRESRVPPVFPLLHALVGLSFKLSDSFALRVDGGFRNALYAGSAVHYFF
ncbi:MAG: hypothetical protein IPL40_08605 [Proteobacteria bacterium]|nr:hypothetical protein [Pseudomonadota bacterium]